MSAMPNQQLSDEEWGHTGKHGASRRGGWVAYQYYWSDEGLDDREQEKEQAWGNLSLVWGLEIQSVSGGVERYLGVKKAARK